MDIYTRHQGGASTLSFLGDDSSPEKTKKHDSSFSEFPPVRHLLDRLHATSPGTNSASAARAAGQRLPCANVQDRVRVDRSHSLGRAPGGGKKHGNLTLLELLPLRFFFFFLAETGGRACGTGEAEQPRKSRKSRGPRGGASELRGLPAHLPRNLASFSPSVDDRDGGGPRGPRQLVHHRHFLLHRRGGATVLMVHLNGRGQRGHRRT